MGFDAPSHWLIIIALAVVIFGYKKLPDASRSLGRSLRIFKTEIKGMSEDDKAREAAATVEAPAVVPAAEAPVATAPAATAPVVAAPVAQPAPVAQVTPVAEPTHAE
ncbi:Sec-independent protein translocase subunit TatA [Jatrophihabitans sp.]|uniref:Sec-independent protein translocase subunit TatA n=1 Tax=Jatrophihabitans sp. TaxID=1932789 RepID=UPI0030C77D9C|nr:tatA [Jatrophihabitans sp.]